MKNSLKRNEGLDVLSSLDTKHMRETKVKVKFPTSGVTSLVLYFVSS